MRRIAIVTVARSDYGILRPLIDAVGASSALELHLIVGGMHLDPSMGNTVEEIKADGYPIAASVPFSPASDSRADTARAMGAGVSGFAGAYEALRPDVVVILGDRFEALAACVAAAPFNLPVAHLHGGELTYGAIDDAIRHAITKLSHLHFASTDQYARRIIQMGEQPWRVHTTGALGIDAIKRATLLDATAVQQRFGVVPGEDFALVTFHPVTREEDSAVQAQEVLAALEMAGLPTVLTYPNADPAAKEIIALIEAFAARHQSARTVRNAGSAGYFTLMSRARCMVGNSSSGILEAASFQLPVVNVGTRQQGRLRAANVIDCEPNRAAVTAAIERATAPAFRSQLRGLVNPYGDGATAARMVALLEGTPLDDKLVTKRFHDIEASAR